MNWNSNKGSYKWSHYLEAYERELSGINPKSILEIGIYQGGCLENWKSNYPNAIVTGIDIKPSCYKIDGCEIIVGDQSNKEFLTQVACSRGPFDIIIDDGSHFPFHQKISFNYLWPHINHNGIYIIEDIHSSFFGFHRFRRYRGGIINFISNLIKEMHSHWSLCGIASLSEGEIYQESDIGKISIYDSILFIHKRFERLITIDRV